MFLPKKIHGISAEQCPSRELAACCVFMNVSNLRLIRASEFHQSISIPEVKNTRHLQELAYRGSSKMPMGQL